jgi:hypothetical protein
VWTEKDDKEIEYGKWHRYTAKTTIAEEYKIHPPKEDIWPHWSEGVPTKLRRKLGCPAFVLGAVHYRYPTYYASVDLDWNAPAKLSLLGRNYRLLPRNYRSEWSGIYRIFSPDTTIDRCCGKDPTGTLYLGQAGSRGRSWSTLRTRIMSIVKRGHHAIRNWNYNQPAKQKFPWESLAVEWAFMGKRLDLKGDSSTEALLAEAWLLACYADSYGEYPPWNQKG